MSDQENQQGINDEKKAIVYQTPSLNISISVTQPKAPEKEEAKPDEKEKDTEKEKQDEKKEEQSKPPVYKKPGFIIGAIILFLILVIGGVILWLVLRQYVSTDDAYIDGHVVQVSPQINARITRLNIMDNQFVHRGDLLVELDTTDFDVATQQAHAQRSSAEGRLAQAEAQVITARAEIPEATAQEHAAQAALENAARDLERFQKVDPRARSKQQLDQATTSKAQAQAQFERAHAGVVAAEARVTSAEAAVKAAVGEVDTAKASERRAEVNLSYCKVFAPIDGRVTQRTVEAGNYAMAGQALCLLVDPNVWVTANFKETQLTHMEPGQTVTIKIDAFPKVNWQGHVDSIQSGSGARFSVLPAENATGNYVKVVQRVPVKIYFEHDANTNNAYMLSPGLSVRSRVKVR